MPTIEERLAHLESVLVTGDDLGPSARLSELEKELAVLKGRTDGLEAKVGELEARQGYGFLSSLLFIKTLDVNTGEITTSVKPQSTNDTPGSSRLYRRRLSSDEFSAVVMFNDGIILNNSVNNGVYETKSIRHYGDTSTTGKDLVLGGSALSKNHYLSFGWVPTPSGQRFIINKQKINN
jgi:hypothetical protein